MKTPFITIAVSALLAIFAQSALAGAPTTHKRFNKTLKKFPAPKKESPKKEQDSAPTQGKQHKH